MYDIDALMREYDGYVSRGLDDRAEQVAAIIAAHGATVPAVDEPKPEPEPEVAEVPQLEAAVVVAPDAAIVPAPAKRGPGRPRKDA